MKNWVSRWTCFGLFLLLFSCQLKSRNANAPIEITLSGWQSNPNESKLLASVINDFEIKHPNIKVKREVINSQYMDVIKTRLIGDVAPDVFYLEAFEAPMLMKSGVLEPLNAYITPSYDLADFEPSLLTAFQQNGKLYGVPKDFSTLALFYNTTAFQNAKLAQPPKTWAELTQHAKQLTVDTNRDGKPDRYGMGIAPELPRQLFMIQAFGGRLTDHNNYASFATPNAVKGLQLLVDQYRRDRTVAQPSDVGANSNSEAFGQGKIAMAIEGAWAIPYLKETFPDLKFAIAEVPTLNGKKGTMAFTVAYVMNRQSKHKDAAWKLIEFLTSKDGMKSWATEGLALPSRQSVAAALKYDRDPLYAPLATGATYATIWQSGETLPTVMTSFDNQFISALLGQQPLKDAMKKAQDTANREIYWSN
ncbi:extracellular solute-binding protein [Myxacorys almedinensis A]|uniref:Extracellular solute-binding protein n=1 Tax=Myxacorys almedinensis A TaxID=2690445 RepID=A0A8J8CKZ8_9CYAN|nr:extracellular solute-binding protein [Myxacorys almedinensis A]